MSLVQPEVPEQALLDLGERFGQAGVQPHRTPNSTAAAPEPESMEYVKSVGVAESVEAAEAEAVRGNARSTIVMPPSVILALALLARCGAAGSSCLCYVAAAEQFPTGCRNSGIGFGSACGRVASILAPLAVNLLSAPFLALAVVAALAALATLALPETAGKPITEHSEQPEAKHC